MCTIFFPQFLLIAPTCTALHSTLNSMQKAAALDPHDVASGAGVAAEEARSKRYDSCYQHVMGVLRFLVDPSAGE